MRKTKSLLALLCAVVAAFVLAVPAFAATGPHTITIQSDVSGHTYEAYQVFGGDISADGTTLSNIVWGDGVVTTDSNSDGIPDLLDALKADPGIGDDFASATSAADVAAVLENYKANKLDIFTQVIGGDGSEEHPSYLNAKTTSDPGVQNEGRWSYSIKNLAPGYYLVRDADGSPTTPDNPPAGTKTKFMLEVVADVTAEAKDDTIPVDKEITGVDSEETEAKAEDAAIGDEVEFTITTTVPEMDGYNRFKFVVEDTLSAGLTYKANSLKVYLVDTPDAELTEENLLEKGTDYKVTEPGTPEEDQPSTLTVTFLDFLQRHANDNGKTIKVVYTATVDTDAVIGVEGNPNDVKIVFSNDPNYNYEGDDPEEGEPKGETPKSTVRVYVTGLQLKKVDQDREALPGAQFEIKGDTLNTTLITGVEFVKNQDGTGQYYLLTSGAYTTTKPAADGSQDNYYQSTTQTYDRKVFSDSVVEAGGELKVTAWVNDQGILEVDGLKAGTYTITELTAPDGYNKVDPITVTIGWEAPTTVNTACKWTVTSTPDNLAEVSQGIEGSPAAGIIVLTIQNLPGATLPSTGGIGTTIFYAVGATLVIGAGVVLVSRYRANHMK